jgi:2-amino-4-hydroxy-6-hydroxymethyldihydropteridine diphosphokinase
MLPAPPLRPANEHRLHRAGANLGDPAATVKAAFAALANLPESRIVHCSSLYRTAPVGITEQPEFVNAVAQLETDAGAGSPARRPA